MRRKESKTYHKKLEKDKLSDTNRGVYTGSSFKVCRRLRLSLQILQELQRMMNDRLAARLRRDSIFTDVSDFLWWLSFKCLQRQITFVGWRGAGGLALQAVCICCPGWEQWQRVCVRESVRLCANVPQSREEKTAILKQRRFMDDKDEEQV